MNIESFGRFSLETKEYIMRIMYYKLCIYRGGFTKLIQKNLTRKSSLIIATFLLVFQCARHGMSRGQK